MDQTTIFILFTLIGILISSAFVFSRPSEETAGKKARSFYFLCLFLSLAALTAGILSVSGILPMKGNLAIVYQALIFRLWLVIGMGIVVAALSLFIFSTRSESGLAGGSVRSFVSSPYLLRGICFSVSVSFLATELGKLTHDADMRQFFLESGFPVWFLYFVIVAEIFGAVALFIPRLIIPAASGLAILMLGAIHTHFRNGDPFSDSIEALHLLILLICIIIIRLFYPKH